MTAPASDKQLQRYVELAIQRRELEQQLKEIKAAMADLEEPVLSYFEEKGIDRVTINGITLYPRRELWAAMAEGMDQEKVCQALIAAGLEEYVGLRFNTTSLSAFLRDLEAEGQPLPPELEGVIVPVEKFKVGTRKA